jgi:hypothetical protein
MTQKRHETPPVTTLSAEEAFHQVLSEAGCVRPYRDAVDERIPDDVRKRRTRLVKDPADVGGWPDIPGGVPAADSDHDGMPDAWEQEHRFNPADAEDGPSDADKDGYTNVEEYLNRTDPHST